MINGIYCLIGIVMIIIYDFCINMVDNYFRKKRKHIDIEVIKDKLYINGQKVKDIHIEV